LIKDSCSKIHYLFLKSDPQENLRELSTISNNGGAYVSYKRVYLRIENFTWVSSVRQSPMLGRIAGANRRWAVLRKQQQQQQQHAVAFGDLSTSSLSGGARRHFSSHQPTAALSDIVAASAASAPTSPLVPESSWRTLWPQPKRLVALGDVHGDIEAFEESLVVAGVVRLHRLVCPSV
jgi:hypothetical protein